MKIGVCEDCGTDFAQLKSIAIEDKFELTAQRALNRLFLDRKSPDAEKGRSHAESVKLFKVIFTLLNNGSTASRLLYRNNLFKFDEKSLYMRQYYHDQPEQYEYNLACFIGAIRISKNLARDFGRLFSTVCESEKNSLRYNPGCNVFGPQCDNCLGSFRSCPIDIIVRECRVPLVNDAYRKWVKNNVASNFFNPCCMHKIRRLSYKSRLGKPPKRNRLNRPLEEILLDIKKI